MENSLLRGLSAHAEGQTRILPQSPLKLNRKHDVDKHARFWQNVGPSASPGPSGRITPSGSVS